MNKQIGLLVALASVVSGSTVAEGAAKVAVSSDLAEIETIVIIYAENRSFDNLYGLFPGANGLRNAAPENFMQLDRDGSILTGLPPSRSSGRATSWVRST